MASKILHYVPNSGNGSKSSENSPKSKIKHRKPCGFRCFRRGIYFDLTTWLVAPKKISQDFLKNPLVTRLFRTFLYFFLLHVMVGDLSCPISLRTEKDIIPIKSTSFLPGSVPRFQNIPILFVGMVCAFSQKTSLLVPNIQAPH